MAKENKEDTGKSFSETLFLASTKPQYDKRLFVDLPVQYMNALSFYVTKTVLVGPKWFWSDQIDLDLTIMIWSQPK